MNPYIERRQRAARGPRLRGPLRAPVARAVLRDTLGTIIFQDQVIEVALAVRGLQPGEAEGLRRAMSRKRSQAAIRAYHERFVEGAAAHPGVDATTAHRVYEMIVGFSGFGFPKAHGAAFGLLAYQSAWLRVHYRPSSSARCSTSSRWASTPPTRSCTTRSGAGSRSSPPTSTRARSGAPSAGGGDPHRPRLRQRRAGARGRGARRRARAGGPFRSVEELASRAGPGARRSNAWPGRARATDSRRRPARRAVGARASTAPGYGPGRAGPSSRCPWTSPTPRRCAGSAGWAGWSPTMPPPA